MYNRGLIWASERMASTGFLFTLPASLFDEARLAGDHVPTAASSSRCAAAAFPLQLSLATLLAGPGLLWLPLDLLLLLFDPMQPTTARGQSWWRPAAAGNTADGRGGSCSIGRMERSWRDLHSVRHRRQRPGVLFAAGAAAALQDGLAQVGARYTSTKMVDELMMIRRCEGCVCSRCGS